MMRVLISCNYSLKDIIHKYEDVQQMKKEIIKILALKRKDLHGDKLYLYLVGSFSIIIVHTLIISHLGERLSQKTFILFIAVYFSILFILALISVRVLSKRDLDDQNYARVF